MFDPKSPQGLAISNLFVLTLLIAAVIFLLVTVLVLFIGVRFRKRKGEDDEPKADFGRTKLELAWTAAPTLLLAVLFVFTIQGMGNANPDVQQGTQPDLLVIAHQWWWEIRYPQANAVTANEIHLPTGKRMLAHLESGDVIHDLWIPEIGRKMDMVPGQPNDVWLEADKVGVYLGACAEYCGVEHARMLIRAIAQPPADYDAWLSAQAKAAPPIPTTGNAARGAQIFGQKTCISCHTLNGAIINGITANARIGPDLTHVAGRQTLAAGTLENTPANMAKWIKDPQIIKPGSLMPDLQLTDDEVNALVDYMETLK